MVFVIFQATENILYPTRVLSMAVTYGNSIHM